jgi:HEAT repeat protein
MRKFAVLSLLAIACATTGAVESALVGDLGTLRKGLAEEKRRGELDQRRVTEIARAVAAREIYSGTGVAGARRIHSMRACAEPLLDELDARADRPDEGGAEATLTLFASGRLRQAGLFDRYNDADSAAWRAVAARAALEPETFTARRKFFVDPDERVRRAALEAANATPSPLDFDALLEAGRVDPDPMARSLAVRGIGALGGERATRGLADLWERADEDVRLAILSGYAAKPTFASGGREALLHAAESGRGVVAVAAAGELLRVDPSARGAAITLLLRALREGGSDEQRLAILLLPVGQPGVVDGLKKASDGVDPGVRVAALEKLSGLPPERTLARAKLRQIAKAGSNASDDANHALARTGDASVAPKFRTDLSSKNDLRREAAGRALVALGDWPNAATLLGDGSADVRVATACTILAKN